MRMKGRSLVHIMYMINFLIGNSRGAGVQTLVSNLPRISLLLGYGLTSAPLSSKNRLLGADLFESNGGAYQYVDYASDYHVLT